MSIVIVGRDSSFLMTNGKFGYAWSGSDFKRIKLFENYRTSYEIARDKGAKCLDWMDFYDELAFKRVKWLRKRKKAEKNRLKNARWIEINDDRKWKIKEDIDSLDLLTFEWFKPKRMLMSEYGYPIKIEGETPCLIGFHTYDDDEVDYLSEVYEVVQ